MTAATIIAAFACLGATLAAQEVDVCNPGKFQGAYGFQISGHTTISGVSKPVASIGRWDFDGQGGITGTSSVNFAGYYLGNPVTGKYELTPDCVLDWSLQDDSGGWQHFRGKLTPDLLAARFSQTDAGAAQDGTMQHVAPNCSAAALSPDYSFTLSGNAIPMNPGEVPRHISADGLLQPDAAGALKLTVAGATGTGSISIDSDCVATITMNLPAGLTVALRGILVDSGKRILAVETDPGTTVTAVLNAKPQPQPR